ncbi:MAG: DUF4286 family protein [Crocinitomicaceae bacterium]|jgi:hypothetical protein|nr:DUF4286 family protein [Crocinitomicaceae bacterium]MBT6515481.1 DUF4286 family protein [Crocinitomicaceae bacterium]
MIVYSVTVKVNQEIEENWLRWMKEVHIPDVMATGFFLEKRWSKVIGETDGGTSYNVQYLCASMKDLHDYQVHHAPALQKEHSDRYKDNFVAFRTLLETIDD